MAPLNEDAERRVATRYPVELPATLVLPGQSSCPGAIFDLSLSGTMFLPDKRPDADVGTHGVFCVAERDAALETVVRVARVTSVPIAAVSAVDGLGLQFISPSHSTRAKLDHLTKLAS